MKKREFNNNQQDAIPSDATPASNIASQKVDAAASGKPERKNDVKAAPRSDERSNAKTESKQELNAENTNDGADATSLPVNGHRNVVNKIDALRMSSYASVAKGAASFQDGQNFRGYYRNDQHRRRPDNDAEEDDVVKTMMRLYRMRYKEFRMLIENPYRERDAANSQEQRASRSEQIHNSLTFFSASSSNDSVVVPTSKEDRFPSGGDSDELQIASAPDLPNSTLSDGVSVDVDEHNEAAGDESNTYGARQRRHDGVRINYFDRRRRNFNGRFPADGEDRGFSSYGRYKNKYNGHNNTKRDFKKDEKPQEA
uniref:Uncharacterized protein n=1 Tax=Babesia sp. BQ1/Lintan TaxID=669259 RepID=D0V3W5_9APIC|nr:hypothetical protein BQP35 [Babesia sp. BQ1/Lintan]